MKRTSNNLLDILMRQTMEHANQRRCCQTHTSPAHCDTGFGIAHKIPVCIAKQHHNVLDVSSTLELSKDWRDLKTGRRNLLTRTGAKPQPYCSTKVGDMSQELGITRPPYTGMCCRKASCGPGGKLLGYQ